MMNGFKALGKDMKALFGDGMKYEMNKNYTMGTDKIIPGKRGYHFFDNLRDIFYLFNTNDYAIYEIEANDYIEKIENSNYIGKYVTNNIKVVRKLSEEEIDKYIDNNLNELLETECMMIKMTLAKRGHGLDIFINDKHWKVRREVAKQGYRLDILVNDNSLEVRLEVARQGYGLYTLVNDVSWEVRLEVAKHGYGLDILINDEHWKVRREVAKQGYGLDILVNDKSLEVSYEVAKHRFELLDWK